MKSRCRPRSGRAPGRSSGRILGIGDVSFDEGLIDAADQDRDPRHGRRGRRRARRLDRRPRRAQRLPRPDDLGARRRPAHRRDDLLRRAVPARRGRARRRPAPVLALMPMPGDVDVVLASELMEAGRAVQRGLVTPDRTTLIASTHRVYSIAEKTALGDGRVDGGALAAIAQAAAASASSRFDMAQVADEAASVISAVLFGALAGTGALPFAAPAVRGDDRARRRRRRGQPARLRRRLRERARPRRDAGERSRGERLRRLGAGRALGRDRIARAGGARAGRDVETARSRRRRALERVRTSFPARRRQIVVEGVRRTIDYQDVAYARLYLDRLALDRVRAAAPARRRA